MSNYKGHLFGGLCVYLITIYIVHQNGCIISLANASKWLFLSLAGSLFPDVDVKSRGQNYFYWLILLLLIALLYMNNIKLMAFIGFIAIIPQISRHRGMFHSLWFVIVVPIVIAVFIWMHIPNSCETIVYDTLFFVIGALSHLLLDRGLRGMLRN